MIWPDRCRSSARSTAPTPPGRTSKVNQANPVRSRPFSREESHLPTPRPELRSLQADRSTQRRRRDLRPGDRERPSARPAEIEQSPRSKPVRSPAASGSACSCESCASSRRAHHSVSFSPGVNRPRNTKPSTSRLTSACSIESGFKPNESASDLRGYRTETFQSPANDLDQRGFQAPVSGGQHVGRDDRRLSLRVAERSR